MQVEVQSTRETTHPIDEIAKRFKNDGFSWLLRPIQVSIPPLPENPIHCDFTEFWPREDIEERTEQLTKKGRYASFMSYQNTAPAGLLRTLGFLLNNDFSVEAWVATVFREMASSRGSWMSRRLEQWPAKPGPDTYRRCPRMLVEECRCTTLEGL